MTEQVITFEAMEQAANLFGSFDENIKLLEREYGVTITCRGADLKVVGDAENVAAAARALNGLLTLINKGEQLTEQNVRYVISLVGEGNEDVLSSMTTDSVCVTAKGRPVKPKTVGQKRYCESIAKNTITFGVGPAGTGKTYLAVAMAVTAFRAKEVNRIILTRPAVEAGEKLGFLPGDLAQKVDPYLRPLYDALHEMMGLEAYQRLVERGAVEVAPLAYMRGRTLKEVIAEKGRLPERMLARRQRAAHGCIHRGQRGGQPCGGAFPRARRRLRLQPLLRRSQAQTLLRELMRKGRVHPV